MEMSTAVNGTRFRRVTDGNPCAFCAMLATRDDYRTAESAMYVVGRTKNGRKTGYLRSKGKRSIGSKFHELCGCTVAEVLGDWEPSAKEQAYSDLYYDAVQACKDDGIPTSPENITPKMRELGEGVINDAHKPETQTGSSGGNGGKPPKLPRRGKFNDEQNPWLSRSRQGPSGRIIGDITSRPIREQKTIQLLASYGVDVSILEHSYEAGTKNPDIKMDGHIWDIKGPTGDSERSTIETQFSKAKAQAKGMVLDLRWCGLEDEVAIAQARRRFYGRRQLERLIIIDHLEEIQYHEL